MSNNQVIAKRVAAVLYIVLIVFVVRYLFFNKSSELQHTFNVSSTEFNAASDYVVWEKLRPLETQLKVAGKLDINPEKKVVDTYWGEVLFSAYGAVVERIMYKGGNNGLIDDLYTVFPVNMQEEPYQSCFLLVCGDHVITNYTLVNQVDNQDSVSLTYVSNAYEYTIKKIFTVHKGVHKIDICIEYQRSYNEGDARDIRFKMIVPNPTIPTLGDTDILSIAILPLNGGSFQKFADKNVDGNKGWFSNSIIGLEDKYFLHALIADQNDFLSRFYRKRYGALKTAMFFESKILPREGSYTLSFYMGPKQIDCLQLVDKRLESAVDYHGILAPIPYVLLRILSFLYGYVHNYGFAILLLTLFLKLLFLPFNRHSNRQQKLRGDLQRKLDYVNSRYKNDHAALARERAAVIRQHGIPWYIIPLFMQLPLMIALSRVLSNSIELFRAPMLWIPDLSVRDPYYILPFMLAIAMILQAFHMETSQRPAFLFVTCIAVGIAATTSSGLALYMMFTTLLTVIQNEVDKRFVN